MTFFRWSLVGRVAPGWMLWLTLAFSVSSPVSSDPGPFAWTYEGLHDRNVSALAWDGESLWAGTFDAGLARLRDGRWSRVEITGPPKHRWINALCWDGETLWVGSAGGLARWNASSGSLEQVAEIEGPVNSIRLEGEAGLTPSGELVVAGNDRVWIRRSNSWETIDRPGETLHAAFLDRDTLWTGGMWGAQEQRGETQQRYSELNGLLPHSWVTALLPVGDTVWAGTYDAGLVILADEGPAEVLRPEAWVNFNALARTGDGVAVGTMEDGLLLWNRSEKTWLRLTRADGLPSDDVTAIVEAAGVLWVGTRGGVAELRWPTADG